MVNSIQQFINAGVEKLEKTMIEFSANPARIAEMVYGVTDSMVQLGLDIIAEELESYDEILRSNAARKKNWYIVRRDETSLLTSLGTVRYKKTLFKNKDTGKCEYLLDKAMKLDKHTRITEDEVFMLQTLRPFCQLLLYYTIFISPALFHRRHPAVR